MIKYRFSILLACMVALIPGLRGAESTIKVLDREPPKEISEAIRSNLQGKAIQWLKNGELIFEFWLNTQTPFAAKPESGSKAFQALKEGTLLGAVAVHGSQRDYRDDDLAEGAYTMRYGVQPKDGNHLGTTEFPFFALLVPAKSDPKPETLPTYKALVKASSSGTTTDHPRVLSLRPVSDEDTTGLPKLNSPLSDHKTFRLQLPGMAGEAKQSLIFELVVDGTAKK